MPVNRESVPSLLTLPEAEMRSLGYRVVDVLVDHFAGMDERPVSNVGRPAELKALIGGKLPATPGSPHAVLDNVIRNVFGHIMHTQHPRFMAFVPSPSNYVSVLADALVAGFNPFAGTWMEASGPAVIEQYMIEWLREICRLPETAGGLFTSGGSVATLTALAAAREARLGEESADGIVYMSDQTHAAVLRALKLLGFRGSQIRVLSANRSYRLPVHSLRQAIDQDLSDGKRPFCVVANAGTTNTGAIDPLVDIAQLCKKEGLWFHIDGAYGAAAAILDEVWPILAGLEKADSIVIDPHKWLFQPYEIGCVLLRDREVMRKTFQILPEYLQDLQGTEEEINYCDYGIQLTRSFRALKLWMSLQTFGLDAFRDAVRRGIAIAEQAERYIRESKLLEIVTPAQIGILTFRLATGSTSAEKDDGKHRQIVEALKTDGQIFVSSTRLNGTTVLRLCTINPRTTDADLKETVRRIEKIGNRLS